MALVYKINGHAEVREMKTVDKDVLKADDYIVRRGFAYRILKKTPKQIRIETIEFGEVILKLSEDSETFSYYRYFGDRWFYSNEFLSADQILLTDVTPIVYATHKEESKDEAEEE